MKPYRIGISGAGFGATGHLPALLAHPRFEVVAIASPSSAARIAAERKIPHAFASCEEMVAGCELDAVTVASPPFAHRGDVLAALTRGKHVLCEKPFGLDVAQAQEMVDAAKRAGTACGASHEFRFVPQVKATNELIANHHLDPLRSIEIARNDVLLTASTKVPRSWWFSRERGGGVAGASLSHAIDRANWFAGRPPRRVAGFTRIANPERTDAQGSFTSTVDDGAFALLDYGEGLIARLSADATAAVPSFLCAVHGESRTAAESGPDMLHTTLYTVDDDETNELECKPSEYAKFASVSPMIPLLMELYDEFAQQIETGTSALPTFGEALETQRVLAAIGF